MVRLLNPLQRIELLENRVEELERKINHRDSEHSASDSGAGGDSSTPQQAGAD
jgi:hypothetical protein